MGWIRVMRARDRQCPPIWRGGMYAK